MASLKVLYERQVKEPSVRDGKVLNQAVAVEARRWLDEKSTRNDVVIETLSVTDGEPGQRTPVHFPGATITDWEVIDIAISAFQAVKAAHPVIGKTTTA